ncbi:MAG: LytTR family DNA-binding domain-containing protein [Pseudomonadota bacterium]
MLESYSSESLPICRRKYDDRSKSQPRVIFLKGPDAWDANAQPGIRVSYACISSLPVPTRSDRMWKRLTNSDYRPGSTGFYGVALLATILIYAIVLALTSSWKLSNWLEDIAANVLPLIVLAIGTRLVLLRFVFSLPPILQIIAHVAGALIFSALFFFFLMVFLGAFGGAAFLNFSVRPFFGGAALWQLMQGATFYALISLVAYAETLRMMPSGFVGEAGQETKETPSGRLFVRDGDEMRTLDTGRVVSVQAAGDYVEVVTLSDKLLLRVPLGELEKSLGAKFLRVHRSTIVNIDHVDRVEPAGGGRLSVHLANGTTATASRSGARTIRERAL